MNDRTDRVAAALQMLGVMSGGTPPATDRLVPLSRDERADADDLFAAGLDASGDARARRVALLTYLVEHAPGAPTIQAAYNQLTDEQLSSFHAIADDDS